MNVTESDCTGRFEGLVQQHYKTLASARNNGTFAVNFFTFFSFASYQSTSISEFVNCVFIGRFVENTEWNNETERSHVTVMKCCVTGSESLHRCPKPAINQPPRIPETLLLTAAIDLFMRQHIRSLYVYWIYSRCFCQYLSHQPARKSKFG